MRLTRLATADSAAAWLGERSRGTLRADSRRLRAGDVLLAWPGHRHDARRHVEAALRGGAAACLVDAAGVEAFRFDDPRIAALPALQQHAGAIADRFFGRPSERLTVVASTGTNGKTSTTWWLAQALAALGRRCAVIGTLGVGEPPVPGADAAGTALVDTGLTTPDAVELQRALQRLVDQGFAACAIEASSIGLHQHRLAGTRIEMALFTNLTLDHLDYHGSMQAYRLAKRRLFEWPGLKSAVINVDDEVGAALADELAARPAASRPEIWRCAAHRDARLRARGVRHADGGLAFEVHEGDAVQRLRSAVIGEFNVANLLLVIGALRALGHSLADAVRAADGLGPVPGRLQRLAVPGAVPEVVVDYAHSPDALEKALLALRPFAAARGGRLWCVFGCGGNRDAAKRPLMGAIAVRLADQVLLTSDNPRDEAPRFILSQILAGITGHEEVDVIEDRRAAIAEAVQRAAAEDVVLLAGKGHEAWQEVAGRKRPFSDVDEALAALRRRAGAGG